MFNKLLTLNSELLHEIAEINSKLLSLNKNINDEYYKGGVLDLKKIKENL